ncbi:MAG: PKD domain-containing protein [Candidatus Thermoplasmatota archaeon]
MKVEKIITGILMACLCCLILPSVTALEVIQDGPNDVVTINYMTEESKLVTTHPDIQVKNIDIKTVTYDQLGTRATVTLSVYGRIENRGNIANTLENVDDLSSLNFNYAQYGVTVITSDDSYQLIYINQKAQVIYSDSEIINLTSADFSVNNDLLTISFNLRSDTETYDSLEVEVLFIKMNLTSFDDFDMDELDETAFVYLVDTAPNAPLEAIAEATNIAEAGKPVQFNATAIPFSGLPPYTYHWDFGDGETATEQNPIHIYKQPGSYNYTLTVTDSSTPQQSATDTGTIKITGATTEGTPNNFLIFLAAIIIIALIGIAIIIYILRR